LWFLPQGGELFGYLSRPPQKCDVNPPQNAILKHHPFRDIPENFSFVGPHVIASFCVEISRKGKKAMAMI
jgi:hypothetical protein